MPFKYPTRKSKLPDRLGRPMQVKDNEVLTGLVNGEKASDLEERVARALKKRKIGFQFQYPVRTSFTFPNKPNSVDFVASTLPRPTPIEVNGTIGHNTASELSADDFREQVLNQVLEKQGFNRIVVLWQWQLGDQETADRFVERLV